METRDPREVEGYIIWAGDVDKPIQQIGHFLPSSQYTRAEARAFARQQHPTGPLMMGKVKLVLDQDSVLSAEIVVPLIEGMVGIRFIDGEGPEVIPQDAPHAG